MRPKFFTHAVRTGILEMAVATVPTIQSHDLMVFLLQVSLLLALAVSLGGLAKRFKLPAIVGELCAGVLVGPSLLGYFAPGVSDWIFPQDPLQFHLLDAVAQVGVLLLVGVSATEIDMRFVRRNRKTATWVSLGGLIVPLAAGIAIGFVVSGDLAGENVDSLVFALFIGVAMCVSAIPVIAKIMTDMNFLHRNVGQLTLTAAMSNDAVGWLLLPVVSAMATVGLRTGDVLTNTAYVLGILIFFATFGRLVIDTVLRAAHHHKDAGATSAAVTVLVLSAAAATQALHLEAVFGAFLCGIVIGSSRSYDDQKIVSLRSVVLCVLAPLFFATAGLRIDLTGVIGDLSTLWAGAAVFAVAVVGKFAGAYIGARVSKIGHWESLALGAAMNARGIVEVIIANVGVRLGVLSNEAYTIVIMVAIGTSLMAPPMLQVFMARVHITEEEHDRSRAKQATETIDLTMQSEAVK